MNPQKLPEATGSFLLAQLTQKAAWRACPLLLEAGIAFIDTGKKSTLPCPRAMWFPK